MNFDVHAEKEFTRHTKVASWAAKKIDGKQNYNVEYELKIWTAYFLAVEPEGTFARLTSQVVVGTNQTRSCR